MANQIQTQNRRKQDLLKENRRLKTYKDAFARLRDRTFDDNRRGASVLASARINRLARAAGLGEGDYTVTKFSEQRLKDAGWELICTINANSSLDRMVNFLYLLRRDQHLHRVSNLTINPHQKDRRRVRFSLRYSTPVLVESEVAGMTTRQPTTQPVELASLNDPERSAYGVIERRHVFLPYVPRAPQVQGRVEAPKPSPPPPKPPEPQQELYDQLVLVGLPAIGDKAEVHVAMPGGDIKSPLEVGDKLATGLIAMVDYRILPMPGDPKELSQSRVILKIGRDYWSVELGQRLGQRRILRAHELPGKLKKPPHRGLHDLRAQPRLAKTKAGLGRTPQRQNSAHANPATQPAGKASPIISRGG